MPNERGKLGKEGEETASEHLANIGYNIVERNYRSRAGEIDIIAEKDNTIFFVEVKTRRSVEFKESYSDRQRIRLRKLAQTYVAEKEIDKQVSFLVLGISGDPRSSDFRIELIEDNFL
ncbi:YraN family protein [bacterium]|nr:YraN family protein [bacterium]MBU1025822.1 YraN family protein [bacterium]